METQAFVTPGGTVIFLDCTRFRALNPDGDKHLPPLCLYFFYERIMMTVVYKIIHEDEKMTGQPIIGLRDILHMLTHPDMIPFTEKWLFEWYKENHLTTSRKKHLL